MKICIDRDFPVSLGQQLRGQIEYGVACGELPPGSQIPSVRELAAELGIAMVTVSQVYKELQESRLLESRPGRGTFVAEAGPGSQQAQGRVLELQRQIDGLIALAERLGVSRGELSSMVAARLGRHRAAEPLNLTFVGVFLEATRAYAADLRPMLPATDRLEATVLEQLEADLKRLRAVRRADLVIAPANRKAQVQALLGAKVPVVGLGFIPSERTRTALAELGPRTRLGLLTTFPEFLPTMRAGVERFTSHLETPRTAVLADADSVGRLVAVCDVIVYATGSERILEGLPDHVRAFEYRHTPDPRSVDRDLLPVLGRIREDRATQPQS
ncbi:MAG: GntR family transcriptional regulator [Meiothermus sp.]|nr:GntR family transcriptional regulator [Meiothermus sp.]